ncbi:transcription repressor NadR [Gracilibacillus oryzae]|uniref:Transcription repressor NadR n=1 Tax=Gracilibacillus oryzae TaxID=1672701 RepID=A0A7C8GSV3_9BACI|nr:transcription repressor NadR [Gracilibacillus oryzae]KAB8134742.1 transcription repressor NadR [Gracilibacillus oryzae]
MTKKLIGNERREAIRGWLQEADKPLTGGELAEKANVSRQVIVQDITLLKAQNHPIIATSNGYIYMQKQTDQPFEKVIACRHTGEETKEELYAIVDNGAMVKDVMIEHPIYGDLKASIMVSNRAEVDSFVARIEQNNAPYLLQLTDGVHNHTITADQEWKLDKAYEALQQKGFLVK